MTRPRPGTPTEYAALSRLHAALQRELEGSGLAIVGGFEYERTYAYVYAYGPDARQILEVARSVLREEPMVTHARLFLGDVRWPPTPEETVEAPF